MTKKKKPRGWAGHAPKTTPAAPGVFLAPCDVCGLHWPWPWASAQPQPAPYARICSRCLLADLMRVLRECPERFGGLATVRALQGRPPVVVIGRSGDAEKSS